MSSKVTPATSEMKMLPQFIPTSVSTGIPFGQLSVTLAQVQQTPPPSVFSIHSSAEKSVSQPTPSTFYSSPQTSVQQQSFLFGQQLSKTTQPQQLIASPKLNISITSETTLTSVFSHPQSSVSSSHTFGKQAVSTTFQPAGTSVFGQPAAQQTSLFPSIDSTSKTPFTMPKLGSGFAALGSKPVSTASSATSEVSSPSSFVFSPAGSKPTPTSDPAGVKPLSFSFNSALGQKSIAAPHTKVTIDPGFSVMHSSGSGITVTKPSGFNFDAATEAGESSFQTNDVEGVPFLPFDSSLSFANLASKSQQPGFKTGKNCELVFPSVSCSYVQLM
jgi:hypothetical protein